MPASIDNSITGLRAHRALREAELLLAGLVNNSIHTLSTHEFYGHCVRLPNDSCAYLHAAYITSPGLEERRGFSPLETPAPQSPPHDLVGPYGLGGWVPDVLIRCFRLEEPDGDPEVAWTSPWYVTYR